MVTTRGGSKENTTNTPRHQRAAQVPSVVSVEEESVASSVGSSSRRKNVARTNKGGLKPHIQKQLALDIQKLGGIKKFVTRNRACASLCDSNESLYGETGSKKRKCVQNKVQRWKELSELEWRDVLEELGVVVLADSHTLHREDNWTSYRDIDQVDSASEDDEEYKSVTKSPSSKSSKKLSSLQSPPASRVSSARHSSARRHLSFTPEPVCITKASTSIMTDRMPDWPTAYKGFDYRTYSSQPPRMHPAATGCYTAYCLHLSHSTCLAVFNRPDPS